MATVAMTLLSERWLKEVVLIGQKANSDGQVSDLLTFPVGLGDLAIMELIIEGGSAATFLAAVAVPVGFCVSVVTPGGVSNVDIVGCAPAHKTGDARFNAYISPGPLVLWRQNEELLVTGPEMDTNATPTVDLTFLVKCVRLEEPVRAQTQVRLVR